MIPKPHPLLHNRIRVGAFVLKAFFVPLELPLCGEIQVLGDHIPRHGHHLVLVELEGVECHLPLSLPTVQVAVQRPKQSTT